MKYLLLRLTLLCLCFSASSAETSVARKANQEQLSGKTWQALGPILSQSVKAAHPHPMDIYALLDEEFNDLDQNNIKLFLKYVLSYSPDNITIHSVLYRYPHYRPEGIQSDLDQLVSQNLIHTSTNSKSYQQTALGSRLLDSYWQLKIKQTKNYQAIGADELNFYYTVFDKILKSGKQLDRSKSSQKAAESRPDHFEQLPTALKLSVLHKEYTAFMNDIGHYKYDHLISTTANPQWRTVAMSPLAKELMGATRAGRIYDLNRCYQQSNWRVGKTGCDQAVAELIDLEFITKQDHSIMQTEKGSVLSAAAESLADETRYSAWNAITMADYDRFAAAVKALLKK